MKNMSEILIAALIIAAAVVWHSFAQRYQGVEGNGGTVYIVDRLTGKMRLCHYYDGTVGYDYYCARSPKEGEPPSQPASDPQ